MNYKELSKVIKNYLREEERSTHKIPEEAGYYSFVVEYMRDEDGATEINVINLFKQVY
jgi:hypothetical protein